MWKRKNLAMNNPTEIKDIPCSMCGIFTPEDELFEFDWDYGLCQKCQESD